METKDGLKSLSFIGPLLIVINMVAGMFGYDLSDIIGNPTETANTIVNAIGVVLGILGTLKRKSTITTVAGIPNPLAPK